MKVLRGMVAEQAENIKAPEHFLYNIAKSAVKIDLRTDFNGLRGLR